MGDRFAHSLGRAAGRLALFCVGLFGQGKGVLPGSANLVGAVLTMRSGKN